VSSPLLSWSGAVDGRVPDAGVPWHYGDPLGEQRAAQLGGVFVDRSHLGVVRVQGPERIGWLNTLTTQVLVESGSGDALLLDPHGHVEHHLEVVDGVGPTGVAATWLISETAPQLVAFLERMVFWSDVRVDLAQVAVLSTLGALPPGVPVAASAAGPSRPRSWPLPGTDLLLEPSRLAEVAEQLRDSGLRPAGTWAWEALRVAALQPRLGVDTDERTIPNEVSWLSSAVHLDKGCYRGQETVARVHNLGRPARRLVLLHLSETSGPAGSPVLAPGTEVFWEGRVAGRLGTVVDHVELGPVALALLRRQVPVEAGLLVGGNPASIDPDSYVADAGRTERPATARLR
jgi:folate-binding protein YgfZ